MRKNQILPIVVAALAILFTRCPVRADSSPEPSKQAIEELEKWIGEDGKLQRAADGRVTKVTLKVVEKGRGPDGKPKLSRHYTDADLARLAILTDLQKLELDGLMDMDGTGFTALAGLKKFTDLDTQTPAYTVEGFAAIGQVKSLEHVSFEHTHTNIKGVIQLFSALPRLREIQVGCHATDALLRAAADCKTLQKLHFIGHWTPTGDATLTAEGYQLIAKMTQLTELDIETLPGDPHPTASLQVIAQLPHLRSLSFVYGPRSGDKGIISGADLAPLAKLPDLQRLVLAGDKVTVKIAEDGLDPLKDCPKLNDLTMWDVDLPADELKKLKQAKPKLGIRIVFWGKKPDITM